MGNAKIVIELDLGPGYAQDDDGDFFYPVDGPGFDEQIRDRVAQTLLKRLDYSDRHALERLISERMDSAIDERIGAVIAGVIAGPLRKHDYHGKPVGEVFTVNELIVQAVEKFAAAPSGRSDGFGRDKATNLAALVESAVQDALRSDLAKDVAAIRKSVAEQIRERLQGAAADAIAKGR